MKFYHEQYKKINIMPADLDNNYFALCFIVLGPCYVSSTKKLSKKIFFSTFN